MYGLYSHPNSTYSKRVHIYLQYRNLEYETIHVALDKLENRKKPFLAINPYGKVPVLKEGEFLLSESSAIIRYLEEKHLFPNPLFPADLKERALFNQWINQCESEFCFPGSVIYFSKKFIPEEKWETKRMKDSAKRIGRHFDILEQVLNTNQYLSWNQFGLLEILYAPFIEHYEMMDTKVPKSVEDWIHRVMEEPSVKKVLKT
ncbi:glutathione S-transferase family protein [Leptospira biflexa]|uniref:glutathione S-transferase family protein n=1 Tax=Leptospira biflexa TaxID=172 RepID=UPI00109179DE|nr:glutathione S-transferase family protein [Leptospira biflexa]TGM48321.1 glutathione S-transferase family protein [Leptospira biflexa]TGM49213.1 glutathione S-transferase family protein [Leptospira biflexa]TGM54480.1 glutathione S-transferase family protein [Leptospira biflexa]